MPPKVRTDEEWAEEEDAVLSEAVQKMAGV